jgi:hypothetical protein
MICRLLVAAATLAAFSLPAAEAGAQHRTGIGVPNAKSPDRIGLSPGGRNLDACMGASHRRSARADPSACGAFVGGWAYADGEWALYNNHSWEPDSYNDWWHDRPDRAFPRWVQEQHGGPCSEDRMWWSGTGWHC